MKLPKVAKGANTRIEWSREIDPDKGEPIEQEFLIDGFVTPAKYTKHDRESYIDDQPEDQEVLEIFLKTTEGWVPFDFNSLSEEEMETIYFSLSEEYWNGREAAEEDAYDDMRDFESDPDL